MLHVLLAIGIDAGRRFQHNHSSYAAPRPNERVTPAIMRQLDWRKGTAVLKMADSCRPTQGHDDRMMFRNLPLSAEIVVNEVTLLSALLMREMFGICRPARLMIGYKCAVSRQIELIYTLK